MHSDDLGRVGYCDVGRSRILTAKYKTERLMGAGRQII